MQLERIATDAGARWVVVDDDGTRRIVDGDLGDLLALPLAEARARIEAAVDEAPAGALLAPVDRQEVWAAGVTYLRSRDGRVEESMEASVYERVYQAERPELFFKAAPGRSVGDGDEIGIRADSGWDVPEAELAVIVNAEGEIFGWTVGNDVSSRSIEGENPLYLPQAKVYEAACALGPAIVPVWAAPPPPFAIRLSVRRGDAEVLAGETSTAQLARRLDDLIGALRRAMDFPTGVVLLTGTGIVPDAEFTLREGDEVEIGIEGVGVLRNRVRVVGRTS